MIFENKNLRISLKRSVAGHRGLERWMQNAIAKEHFDKIKSLAVMVFEIEIKNDVTNVENARHDCNS